MTTVILVFLMVVLYSFQTLFTRLYTARYPGDEAISTHVFTSVYGFCIALITLVISGFRFAPSGITVMYGLLNALVLLVYNVSIIRATALGSYAIANLSLLSGNILIPLFQSIMFYSLKPVLLQYIGIFIMLVAFVFLNADGISFSRGKKQKGDKAKSGVFGLYCALLFIANGLYGAFLYAQQTAMGNTQRTEMIVISFLTAAIVSFGMVFVSTRGKLAPAYRQTRSSVLFLSLCCLSAVSALHLYVHNMKLVENIAVLNTVNNGGILALSVVYAVLIFKEKLTRFKAIGMVIALGALVLLSVV